MYRTGAYSCPRCSSRLEAMRAGPHEVHACRACGGVMADNVASKALVDRADRELTGFDTEFSMGKRDHTESDAGPCPHCVEPLIPVFIDRANLWVNVCNTHGTWFDAREMHSLARALKLRRKQVVVSGNDWKPDPNGEAIGAVDLVTLLFG